MSKCLRCGAESSWIQGRVLDEPSEVEALRASRDALAALVKELLAAHDDAQRIVDEGGILERTAAMEQLGRAKAALRAAVNDGGEKP